jgi:hypothetical protein
MSQVPAQTASIPWANGILTALPDGSIEMTTNGGVFTKKPARRWGIERTQIAKIVLLPWPDGLVTLEVRLIDGQTRIFQGGRQGERMTAFLDAVGAEVEIAATAPPPEPVAAMPQGRPEVKVKVYKTPKDYEKDAPKMCRDGWHLEGQSARTKKWNMTTGFLTNRQITTITWVR